MKDLQGKLKPEKTITFSKDFIYLVNKPYRKTVNTFEVWLKLNKDHRGSYELASSFANDMYPCVALEIRGGHPSLLWGEPHYCRRYTFKEADLLTEEWVHLAIVRDFESREVRCYINGTLVQAQEMKLSSRELTVGAFTIGGDGTYDPRVQLHAFPGELRSVALFSTVRTPSQILADMTSPEKCPSLIAQYKFVNPLVLSDESRNGYHAVRVPAPSYYIDEKHMPKLEDYDHTFAVLGDIQTVCEDFPSDLHKVYDWLLENKDERKIEYVLGLGDTTNWSSDEAWERAMTHIMRLKGNVPFTVARGNHDTVESYNKHFSYKDQKDTVDGTYDESMLNAYKLFTVGKRKFLLFILDFGPAMEILDWASSIIQKYPDRNVIITTHCYIFRDGELHDASYPYPPHLFGGVLNGDQIWEHLVRKHKNIVLVLCGHTSTDGVLLRHDIGDNGNIISTLLVNPQDIDTWLKGLGTVALLHFRDRDNTVFVRYYSTIKEKYISKSAQFSFKIDFINENHN